MLPSQKFGGPIQCIAQAHMCVCASSYAFAYAAFGFKLLGNGRARFIAFLFVLASQAHIRTQRHSNIERNVNGKASRRCNHLQCLWLASACLCVCFSHVVLGMYVNVVIYEHPETHSGTCVQHGPSSVPTVRSRAQQQTTTAQTCTPRARFCVSTPPVCWAGGPNV